MCSEHKQESLTSRSGGAARGGVCGALARRAPFVARVARTGGGGGGGGGSGATAAAAAMQPACSAAGGGPFVNVSNLGGFAGGGGAQPLHQGAAAGAACAQGTLQGIRAW